MMSGDNIQTYPPRSGSSFWRATLRHSLGAVGSPLRPYCYVGEGDTEQAAIDHLKALEAADTWSQEMTHTIFDERIRKLETALCPWSGGEPPSNLQTLAILAIGNELLECLRERRTEYLAAQR